MRIMIATLTTGTRNTTLKKCLESLMHQQCPSKTEIAILVVENNKKHDPAVRAIVNSQKTLKYPPIFLVLEPCLGIPQARNKALSMAKKMEMTHLAFIDDDAFAKSDWIAQLIKSIKKHACQAVSGPQYPLFPANTPAFYEQVDIYHERKIADGSDIKWAATNNLILNINFLFKYDLKFNEYLDKGGEDKEMLLRLNALGGKIKWNQKAEVSECIDKTRLNLLWPIRRTFRLGTTGYNIERCHKSQPKAIIICLFKGSAYLSKGFFSLLPLAILPNHTALNALCDISHGAGFFYGLMGGSLQRYA